MFFRHISDVHVSPDKDKNQIRSVRGKPYNSRLQVLLMSTKVKESDYFRRVFYDLWPGLLMTKTILVVYDLPFLIKAKDMR